MVTVSVVYHSGGGHTKALAAYIARGAEQVEGVQVKLLEITGEQVVQGRWKEDAVIAALDHSDGIIFGAPTYMGSTSAIFKAFMEGAFGLWFEQRWKDKIAAGFTNSASQSGDKLNVLTDLSIFAVQLSMIWVGVGDPPGNNWSGGTVNDINRLGSWLGLMAQSNGDQGPELAPSQGDRLTAERFGQRVARITKRWREGGTYEIEYVRESAQADRAQDRRDWEANENQ
jgi:multimeric flavodoxin WrbA